MATPFEELRKELLRALQIELAPLGFTAKLSDWSYRKVTPFGFYGIGLASIPHPGVDFDVTVHIGVRHDAVAELCNSVNPHLDKRQKSTVSTVGGELGNLSNAGQMRWTIATEADVVRVTQGIMGAVRELAMPYFERFTSLEEVLLVCSVDVHGGLSPSINNPMDLPRAKTAIAAAFLLGRREKFDRLVEEKTEFLKHKSKQRPDFAEFAALVELLRQKWEDCQENA